MMMFAFNQFEAVRYPAIAQGIAGAITFVTYLVYINFDVEKW